MTSADQSEFDDALEKCKELTEQAVGFEHFQKFLKSDFAKERKEAPQKLGPLAVPEIENKQKNKGKGKKNKKPTTLAAEVQKRMVNAKELFKDSPSNCQANIMKSTAKAYLTLDKDDIMDILKHATCSDMDEDVDVDDIVDEAYAQIPTKYKNSAAAAGGRRRETFARRAAEFQRSRIASILQSMR